MPSNTESSHSPGQALFDAVRAMPADDRQRLWDILSAEFGKSSEQEAPPGPTLRETQPEYIAVNPARTPNLVPTPAKSEWISFQTPARLAEDLREVAQERQTSIDNILNELLSTSLALLQMDRLPDEDIDSLAVRRELAAASVAALGDFWDNEVDLEWQNFQP